MRHILAILSVLSLVGCASEVVVMKGKKGLNGHNSLIETTKNYVDSAICESELGTIINVGLDVNDNSVLDSDEIYQTQVVCDGVDGENGADGQDGTTSNFAVAEVHDPCGDGPGHDEVILELVDGSYLAWYKNLGLSLLNQNVHYRTTDSQKCDFKIDSNGDVVEL